MLDQSFSAENFKRILELENRKGVYLEKIFFPRIAKITRDIKKINGTIRNKIGKISAKKIDELYAKQEEQREERENKTYKLLELVSKKVTSGKSKIELTKSLKPGETKAVYTGKKTPETYFTLKQVQHNLEVLYKVKQANRHAIVGQVKGLLGDGFPKYVIKTDIKEFYESISQRKLIEAIEQDSLLSQFSKKVIRRVLDEYNKKSGSNSGIPRGVGISAFLAELYMRDFDRKVKSLPRVSYYARYVDDIIVIFTPSPADSNTPYFQELKKIASGMELLLNEDSNKTILLDLQVPNAKFDDFTFLGYEISYDGLEIHLGLSRKKIEKFKRRLDLVFESYGNYSKIDEKKARKLLVKRLRFLTSNARLLNNKKNILTGIYFTNKYLTHPYLSLRELDIHLLDKIKHFTGKDVLKKRLLKLFNSKEITFLDGFINKRFTAVQSDLFICTSFSKVVEAWKYAK